MNIGRMTSEDFDLDLSIQWTHILPSNGKKTALSVDVGEMNQSEGEYSFLTTATQRDGDRGNGKIAMHR